MGFWPYSRIFSKYKSDCNTFLETGSHLGDSIQDALDIGFNKILSVELNEEFYNKCCEKFKKHLNKKVFLFQGRSVEQLGKMLDMVDSRAMFWLDAHGTEEPGIEELNLIFNHPIKNHILVLDDIDQCFGGGGGADATQKLILKHNPDYKFEFDACTHARQMIAYI